MTASLSELRVMLVDGEVLRAAARLKGAEVPVVLRGAKVMFIG